MPLSKRKIKKIKEQYKDLKVYIKIKGVLMECNLEIENFIDIEEISSLYIVTDDRTVGRSVSTSYTDTVGNVHLLGAKNIKKEYVNIIPTSNQSDLILSDFEFVTITDKATNLHTLIQTKNDEINKVIGRKTTIRFTKK